MSEYSSGELEKIQELGATPVIYNLDRGGLNPFADMQMTYQLVSKINKIKPDLVFSFFIKPVVFGTLAARFAKVPFIIAMLEGLGYSFTEQPRGLSVKAKLVKNIQVFLYRLTLPKLDKLARVDDMLLVKQNHSNCLTFCKNFNGKPIVNAVWHQKALPTYKHNRQF